MVPAPQEDQGGSRPGLRKGHLSLQQLQLGGETVVKTVPLPCAFSSNTLLRKDIFPRLLFFDDSFTDSSMPAFHFNDSIAVKPSHVKA